MARMAQPSGLRGFRQATTNPTTPKTAENQTGSEPLLAFTLWCARRARGTSAIIKASTAPPSTSAVVGDASPKRRPVTSVVAGACPPAGCASPTEGNATPGPFGERYRSAQNPLLSHRSPTGRDAALLTSRHRAGLHNE